jgi:hypothetical protein
MTLMAQAEPFPHPSQQHFSQQQRSNIHDLYQEYLTLQQPYQQQASNTDQQTQQNDNNNNTESDSKE